jgi:hypothetical protein
VDNTDPLYETVFVFLLSKVGDICDFILGSEKFLQDRARALDLVCSLLGHPESAPDQVFGLGVALVDKLFRQPANNCLHTRFSSLVTRISRESDRFAGFCRDSDIRRKIMDAYAEREKLQAAYWGTLYSLATLIEAKAEDSSPEWTDFLAKTIDPIRETLSEPYGGPRPSPDEVSPDDDLIFPVGKSQMSQREQGKLPATVTVFPKGMGEDDDDDIELEEDEA